MRRASSRSASTIITRVRGQHRLAAHAVAGRARVAEMVEQARARNAGAVLSRRVELRRGSVDSLPYERNTFDAALTINSFQVWQNAVAGLREIHRVIKPGGRVALGFTPYSGQSKKGLMEMLAIADFTSVQIVN